mgnify:CR=1 FL=1
MSEDVGIQIRDQFLNQKIRIPEKCEQMNRWTKSNPITSSYYWYIVKMNPFAYLHWSIICTSRYKNVL